MSATPTVLPTALEAEQALLGSILNDPTALIAARALQPADFSRDAHAIIFATMRQLDDDGLPIDVLTLTTRLERTGQLERSGGSSYVASLARSVPSSGSAHFYAQVVRQAAAPPLGSDPKGTPAANGSRGGPPKTTAPEREAASHPPEPPDDLSPEEARAQLSVLAPGLQTIQSLLHEEVPPARWIVPNLVPEGLTLLAAKPKLGKSWMALGLALAVASGGMALGQIKVEPGPVLYLALEDSKKRLHARTRQLLQGKEPAGPFEVHTHWPRLDEGGLGQLKLWLQAEPDARLIILDTFAKIRGHSKGSTLYGEDYASLEQVQALAHQYEVGILVIHHTGKESREDPLDEVNATQGLNGVADNILILRRERGKAEATLVGDGRELNGVELSLRFDVTTGAWTITEPPEAGAKTPERTQVLRVLQASQEPMSPTQIAEKLDKTSLAIRKLLLRMVRDGDVLSSSYGKYRAFTDTGNTGNSGNTGNTGSSADDEAASDAARETVPHLIQRDISLSSGNTGNTSSNKEQNNRESRSVAASEEGVTLPHAASPGAERPHAQVLPLLPVLPVSHEQQKNTDETSEPAPPPAEAPAMPPAMRPRTGTPRIAEMEVTSLEGLAELLQSGAFYLGEEAVVREAARLVWQTYPESRSTLLRYTLAWLRTQGVPLKVEWCSWIEDVAEQLWRQQLSA